MRQTLALLVVALVLTGAYFMLNKESSNTVLDERAIAYENFDDISKIWIRERSQNGYFLSRKGGKWYYQDTVQLDPNIMSNLERAITLPTIKYIPTGDEAERHVKALNQIGIEVRLYGEDNELLRDYWVGGNTNSEDGTAYLVRGASQPYIMELPFVTGTLRGFFINKVHSIKDKKVLGLSAEDIESVTVNYPKDSDAGFKLKSNNGEYQILPLNPRSSDETRTINAKAIENYFLSFRALYCESHENDNPHKLKITKKVPFCIYDINLANGGKKQFKFWPLNDYLDLETNTKTLEQLKLVERFFVQDENGDFYIVQLRLFKGLMVSYEFFFLR